MPAINPREQSRYQWPEELKSAEEKRLKEWLLVSAFLEHFTDRSDEGGPGLAAVQRLQRCRELCDRCACSNYEVIDMIW